MEKSSRRTFIQQTGALAGGALAGGLSSADALASAQASSSTGAPRLSKAQKLRALLQKPGFLVVPEGHTVIAARLVEAHGFEVVYIPGSMMAEIHLGIPNWGVMTTTEMATIAGHIASEVSIPAIVDVDQGGETSLNTYYTVQEYIKAGIAAFHIEDSLNPKHADQRPGFSGAQPLLSLERMVLRIRAAVDARSDSESDFVIISRTDTRDFDEFLRRGTAFAKAGGDVLMGGALRNFTPEQIDRLTREVPLPLMGISLPARQFRETKVKASVYPGILSQPALALCDTLLREFKERQEIERRPERRLSEEVRSRLTRSAAYNRLAEEWTATP